MAKSSSKNRPSRSVPEWIGARREVPLALLSEEDDPDAPPHVIVWLESGSTEPVALVAVDPTEPPDAALVILEAAMREPAHGPPRRPSKLRVDDTALASFLRKHVDGAIEIVSGDTPEIDALLEALIDQAAGDDDA